MDGTYEDFPGDDAVRLETLHGVKEAEGALLVRSEDGTTVVLNDVVFNMDRKKDPLGWLFTTIMGSAPGPRISRMSKWMLIQDRDFDLEERFAFGEVDHLREQGDEGALELRRELAGTGVERADDV